MVPPTVPVPPDTPLPASNPSCAHQKAETKPGWRLQAGFEPDRKRLGEGEIKSPIFILSKQSKFSPTRLLSAKLKCCRLCHLFKEKPRKSLRNRDSKSLLSWSFVISACMSGKCSRKADCINSAGNCPHLPPAMKATASTMPVLRAASAEDIFWTVPQSSQQKWVRNRLQKA